MKRITVREAEIGNFPWTQTEKDNALAKCRLGVRAWRSKKPMLCFHAVTDEDGHTLENEDESGRRFCEYWRTIFQARIEGARHHLHEAILRYVQKAPDDIPLEIGRDESDESAPGRDGIPTSLHRCAGGLGSQFSHRAYPALFAASRTLFLPKSSDVDDKGRSERSLDAFRPLTLCNCDCKILTTAICRGLQWYTVRCIHPSPAGSVCLC